MINLTKSDLYQVQLAKLDEEYQRKASLLPKVSFEDFLYSSDGDDALAKSKQLDAWYWQELKKLQDKYGITNDDE